VEDRDFAVAVVSTAMTAGMRTKDEAREEDHRDDEDDTGDYADPRGHGGDPVAARLALDVGGRWRRRHRTGRGFRGRGCFAHELDDAGSVDVRVLNYL
jgi:hypothetical protein